jgi:uncharacterized protein (DUF4415 family)
MKTRLFGDVPDHTDAEEARIQAGIDQDPDNPELTDEEIARLRPFGEVFPELAASIRRTRIAEEQSTQEVTIRLDNDVLDALKNGGWGWRRRMNAMLRKQLGLPQVDEDYAGAPLDKPVQKRA